MGQSASSPSKEYVEIRELGRGAFGVVALVAPAVPAGHPASDRRYALKKINFGLFSPSTQAAVKKEVAILSALSHRNVVGVRRAWMENGIFKSTACVLMDYCRGGAARAFAPFEGAPKRRRATTAECRKFAADVLDGLVYLHGMGVVHRDIKLCNILLHDDDDQVAATTTPTFRIADFGISVALKAGAPSRADQATIQRTAAAATAAADAIAKTAAKTTCGTVLYMAPELFVGNRPYGGEVDVYAAGLALREMLEGRPVFRIPGFDLHRQIRTGTSTLAVLPPPAECGVLVVLAACAIANFLCPVGSAVTLASYAVGGAAVVLADGPDSVGHHGLRLLSAAMTAPAPIRPSAATCRTLLAWVQYWPYAVLVLGSVAGWVAR